MNLLLYLSGEVRSDPQLILYVARCIIWGLRSLTEDLSMCVLCAHPILAGAGFINQWCLDKYPAKYTESADKIIQNMTENYTKHDAVKHK